MIIFFCSINKSCNVHHATMLWHNITKRNILFFSCKCNTSFTEGIQWKYCNLIKLSRKVYIKNIEYIVKKSNTWKYTSTVFGNQTQDHQATWHLFTLAIFPMILYFALLFFFLCEHLKHKQILSDTLPAEECFRAFLSNMTNLTSTDYLNILHNFHYTNSCTHFIHTPGLQHTSNSSIRLLIHTSINRHTCINLSWEIYHW